MFVAAHKAFDDDFAAFLVSQLIGRLDFGARHQFGGHAAPVIAVGRLDDHRQTDVFGGLPSVCRAVHNAPFWNRHAACLQQRFTQILISGNTLGNGAGLVGLSRPDTVLACAVAQLHQIAFAQADRRNAPPGRRIHDASGAGSQAQRVHHFVQSGDSGGHLKRSILHRRQHQFARLLQRGARNRLVARTHHDFIDPAYRRAARLAEAALHTRQILQFDGDMFENMSRPGAFAQAQQEAAALAYAAAVLGQRR